MITVKPSNGMKEMRKVTETDATIFYKASLRGINKGAAKSRTEINRLVRSVLYLKAAYVKEKLVLIRAKPGVSVAYIRAAHEQIPVIKIKGVREIKKKGGGVSVKMRKDKPRKMFKGAFIATMPKSSSTQAAGHRGAMKRKTKKRLPIKELKGPTIYAVVNEKLNQIIAGANVYLVENIAREIEFQKRRSQQF